LRVQSGLVVRPWSPNSNNDQDAVGHVLLGSFPVAGARVTVGRYLLAPTAKDGSFRYRADITVPGRYLAKVSDVTGATVNGRPLSPGEQESVLGVSAGISVAYRIDRLQEHRQPNGTILVTGRVRDSSGAAPPPVVLYTYRLNGTLSDASGKPVQGAIVVTRTADRDFWTFSSPSDARGHYTSFFAASDESDADPVPLAIQVATGPLSYGGAQGTTFNFKRLRSTTLNLQLPATTTKALPPATPTAQAGAVYEGVVIGVTHGGKVIKPVSARWPDRQGMFSMVLPASARGKTLHFWQNRRQFFSRFAAVPGGRVDLASWPAALGPAAPSGLATLTLSR
jgi:hypothetical protein